MPAANPSEVERALVQRYVDAHAAADAGAVIELLREDVRFWMPPMPTRFLGKAAIAEFFRDLFEVHTVGEFHLVPTRANRQPAVANYIRKWDDTVFRATGLDVLRFDRGELVEIVTFEPHLFAAFGLPATL